MSQRNTILVVDDNDDIRFALSLLLQQEGYRVVEADDPISCMQRLAHLTPALILLDMNYSRDTTSGQEGLALLEQITPLGIPVILMTAWANIELAVKGLQKGAKDFIDKPWRKDKLLAQIQQHTQKHPEPETNTQWIAQSASMQQLEMMITQLAPTDANILILGENGTGKSQLAARIHQLSHRHSQPFININMGAIAQTLFESELFGHQKGAFTDAKQDRVGAFHRAQKGTLFMDEIGTLPMALQPKLLQVLETGEFTPLGANKSAQVNVRLIAATNHDLAAQIAEQSFRQDLYYRLNTFVITLPPLRERTDDIIALAENFVDAFCKKYHKNSMNLSPQVKTKLEQYTWPGNIRELSHTIERAVLMCTDDVIELPMLMLQETTPVAVTKIPEMTLEHLEKQRILDALEQHNYQISRSAKELGISRNALYRRIEKHQIEGCDE